jgi:hypothetical protein
MGAQALCTFAQLIAESKSMSRPGSGEKDPDRLCVGVLDMHECPRG